MHEAAITRALISVAEKECDKQGLSGRLRVTITIGALTTYKENAVRAYFDTLKGGLLKEATLVVKHEAGGIRCGSCGKVSELKDPYAIFCPSCDSPETEIIKGKDIVLNSISKS